MIKDSQIKRGDIVELGIYSGENSTKKKKYTAISNMKPDKLVVIRRTDENTILVAMCSYTQKKSSTVFQTNVGDIYIQTKCFYPLDLLFVKSCNVYLINSYDAINRIYNAHNQWVEDCKKRREVERILKQKRREEMKRKNSMRNEIKRREKQQQHEKENRYSRAYEIAIINNDRKEMERIEKIVGHPPCQSSRGYTSSCRKGRISNKSFNPKPLNGGKFSPK